MSLPYSQKDEFMNGLSIFLVVVAAVATSGSARAFDPKTAAAGLPDASTYSASLLPELSGVVSWKTLAQVEPEAKGGRIVPKFSGAILSLDQQEVRIQGFMLPMDVGLLQGHFLVSAVPPHCPFCLPAGPDALVEVKAKKPIAFALEPVLLYGKFSVVRDDPAGMLYRLTEAEPIQNKPKSK
jgi:hypothetical protein